MKTDLDALMQSRNLDAILITGPAHHNPAMFYLVGDVHISNADLIKKRGETPILFYNAMERDEAARTGLETKNLGDYRLNDLLKETGGDFLEATVLRYQKMLEELELTSGKIALYGRIDLGTGYAVFSKLKEALPDLEFIGEFNDSLILEAMATKDEQEVERIRKMGAITTSVVGKTAEFVTSHRVKDNILVKPDGQPLTIGDVKNNINLWLAERGADNPQGTIFAIGRDAGVPHSAGNPSDIIRLGKTIVFDIFPCEAGGGYYYDFTRTWCLGYAPDEEIRLYEQVHSVFNEIMSGLKAGLSCPELQKKTCDLFEEMGHPTIQSNPQTQEGYVHGLGHGLGLNVHERPWYGKNATEKDVLVPGVVTTIEPGLYYPEREMGVRLEDTVWIRPDGTSETLADYPLDLVLPVGKK
jgi:Xaa-Pro aminopeptidase